MGNLANRYFYNVYRKKGGHVQAVLPVIALAIEAETFWLFDTQIFMSRSIFILLKMKKDIKYAAAVESEAQTLETIKAASAAHDVQNMLRVWPKAHAVSMSNIQETSA